MATSFWTDATIRDPKRNYRFTVQLLAYPGAATWYAKSVTKPKFAVSETPHMFLNHTFYYPGKVTWETVNVTLVDPAEPDAVANTMAIIQNSGYHPPKDVNDLSTISKTRAVGALKGVVIKQIGSEGDQDLLEEWTLKNAFITNVDIGELSYDNEDLSNVTLTFRYDWATCYIPVQSAVDISGQPANLDNAFQSVRSSFFDLSGR
jgi:hypothetical protein